MSVIKLSGPGQGTSVLDIGDHIDLGTWQSSSAPTKLHTQHPDSLVPVVVPSPPPTTRKQTSGKHGKTGCCFVLYIINIFLVCVLYFQSHRGDSMIFHEVDDITISTVYRMAHYFSWSLSKLCSSIAAEINVDDLFRSTAHKKENFIYK